MAETRLVTVSTSGAARCCRTDDANLQRQMEGTVLTLDDIVRRGSRANPDRVAIIDGETQWTWRDFDKEVNRVASGMRWLGMGAGSRIAVAAYNSAAYFAIYYGAARLGAILCP